MNKSTRTTLAAFVMTFACLAVFAGPARKAEAEVRNFYTDLIATITGTETESQEEGMDWSLVAGIILAAAAIPIALYERRHPDKGIKFMFRKLF